MTAIDDRTCQHERDVQLLTQRSTAALRHGRTAGTLSATMLADETKARCQTECGDTSPYRHVELHPISHADAADLLRPTGYIDILLEEFADMGRSLRAGLRRVLTRPSRPR